MIKKKMISFTHTNITRTWASTPVLIFILVEKIKKCEEMDYSVKKNELIQKIEKIKGWLAPDEAWQLYQLANKTHDKSVIVELGSYEGKSTTCLAEALLNKAGSRIISIDPHEGNDGWSGRGQETLSGFLTNIKDYTAFVLPITEYSYNANKTWTTPIHLLFIDAQHTYENVLRDFNEWHTHIIDGGVIVFHDALETDVWRVIQEKIMNNKNWTHHGVKNSLFWSTKKDHTKTITNIAFMNDAITRMKHFFYKQKSDFWKAINDHELNGATFDPVMVRKFAWMISFSFALLFIDAIRRSDLEFLIFSFVISATSMKVYYNLKHRGVFI